MTKNKQKSCKWNVLEELKKKVFSKEQIHTKVQLVSDITIRNNECSKVLQRHTQCYPRTIALVHSALNKLSLVLSVQGSLDHNITYVYNEI